MKFKELFNPNENRERNHALMKFKREDKMSEKTFKEITGGDVFAFEKEGDSIEGKYVGSVAGQYGDNYLILTEAGEEKTIFGGAVINSKMAKVKAGDIVKVTYIGEVKATSGRFYKDFKVEIAE